jgi:hypothetical protein
MSAIHEIGVVGLTPDSLFRIRAYRKRVDVLFPISSFSNNPGLAKTYRLLSYPSTVLLDSSGVVRSVWTGGLSDTARMNIRKEVDVWRRALH